MPPAVGRPHVRASRVAILLREIRKAQARVRREQVDHEPAFREAEIHEVDLEQLADGRMRAVGSDQVLGVNASTPCPRYCVCALEL